MTEINTVAAIRKAVLANGYQPVAVKTGEKVPAGTAWQMRRGLPPISDIALNTGIICEGLCPADIDVDDADAVEAIVKVFDEVAGHTPLVRGRPNSPRRLLLYRAPDGTRPKKRVIKLGSLGKVELLGLGQQFVAYGMHPSGVEFEWPEAGPDIVKRSDMLVLTPEHEAEIERRLRSTFDLVSETSEPAPTPPRAAPAPRPDNIGARERAAFEAALEAEVRNVATAGEGQRNHTLNTAAFCLAQMVASGWGARQEVETALTEAAFAVGLRQPEIGKTIRSGINSGMAKPRPPLGEREGYGDAGQDVEIRLTKVGGVTINAETGEIVEDVPRSAAHPRDDYASDLLDQSGLVPEIARYILAKSRRRQPAFAVMAAMSVVATIASRQMKSPTDCNLNLFSVLITRSANGKETPLKLAPAILRECGLGVMTGPTGGYASDVAIYKRMHRTPVSLWPANEFGDKLAELTAKGNSPNLRKIIGLLRELWDGDHIDSTEAALRDSVTLLNPALTILAASTPGQFFDVVGSKLIQDGTLNRFIAVYAPWRVRKSEPEPIALPETIKNDLRALANRPGGLNGGRFYLGYCDIDPGAPYIIPWDDDARQRWNAYDDEITDRSDTDKTIDDLAGRCAQNAIRIASVLAVSENWRDPRVTLKNVEMGIRVADQSLADVLAGMADYVPEGPGAALQDKIRQKIAAKGLMTHRELHRSMQKAVKNSRELTDLIKLLEDGGDIESVKVTPEGGGPPTVNYRLRKDAA